MILLHCGKLLWIISLTFSVVSAQTYTSEQQVGNFIVIVVAFAIGTTKGNGSICPAISLNDLKANLQGFR